MSGETKASVSGWTIDTYAEYSDALRRSQDKFDQERDRRYTEVGVEREKALKIKETADLAALGLAREIQTYKDEKANQLREQINSERGQYATKGDLHAAVSKIEETLKPIQEFVSANRGVKLGVDNVWKYIFAAVGTVGVFITIAAYVGRPVVTSNAPQTYVPAQQSAPNAPVVVVPPAR